MIGLDPSSFEEKLYELVKNGTKLKIFSEDKHLLETKNQE